MWNLKVVYRNKTEPTAVVDGSFEDVVSEARKVIEDENLVGIYISKISDKSD